MGARAEPQPFAAGPVELVVQGAVSGAGEARDLVVFEIGLASPPIDVLEHGGLELGCSDSEAPAAGTRAKLGALFDGQTVDGEMVGGKREEAVEIAVEIGEGLVRDGEDEIERQVVEAGGARLGANGLHRPGIVGAAERFQVVRLERLDAQAEPIAAGGTQRFKLGERQRFGVGLDGHFDLAGVGKLVGYGRRDALDAAGLPQAWRPAAEVDRYELPARIVGRPRFELAQDCVGIPVVRDLRADVDGKIAVGAAREAKGEMDVDAEWHLHGIAQPRMETVVYLDNAATTRVDERVAEVMALAMTIDYGNPSSAHRLGIAASRRLETARAAVAQAIGAASEEIYFTSGGTEANALGTLGVAALARGRHAVCSQLEHPSVGDAMKRLAERGWTVTEVGPERSGVVSVEAMAGAVCAETALVALMWVSNELGTVQPVMEVARAVKARAPRAHIHVDAVQALGKLQIDVAEGPIDSLALSAHKIHGPQGAGALWLRRHTRVQSLMVGGGQERGVRPGTQGLPGAVGLGCAVELAARARPEAMVRMAALRSKLITSLRSRLPSLRVNAEGAPHILSLGFPGVPAEPLLHALEARGIYVSAGSACAAKDKRPSGALRAIGVPADVGTIRISLVRTTTEAEIDLAARAIGAALGELGHG